jgi:hypothetical protein
MQAEVRAVVEKDLLGAATMPTTANSGRLLPAHHLKALEWRIELEGRNKAW